MTVCQGLGVFKVVTCMIVQLCWPQGMVHCPGVVKLHVPE